MPALSFEDVAKWYDQLNSYEKAEVLKKLSRRSLLTEGHFGGFAPGEDVVRKGIFGGHSPEDRDYCGACGRSF